MRGLEVTGREWGERWGKGRGHIWCRMGKGEEKRERKNSRGKGRERKKGGERRRVKEGERMVVEGGAYVLCHVVVVWGSRHIHGSLYGVGWRCV